MKSLVFPALFVIKIKNPDVARVPHMLMHFTATRVTTTQFTLASHGCYGNWHTVAMVTVIWSLIATVTTVHTIAPLTHSDLTISYSVILREDIFSLLQLFYRVRCGSSSVGP